MVATGKSTTLSKDVQQIVGSVKRQLFIGGKFVDSVSGKTFSTEDPRTGQPICDVAEAQKEDVDLAVKAARKAFDEGPWPRMTGRQRGRTLFKLADLIERDAEALAQLEALDNGKPVKYAQYFDVPTAVDNLRYFAGWADKINGEVPAVNTPNMQAITYREPLGVIGSIIPWNFPLMMAVIKLGPALTTGNTLVLKAAEQTPLTAIRLAELCVEAGIPDGVVNIIQGQGEVAGAALAAHPDVNKIAFTGSTAVGKLVMKAAAEHINPVTLELGGKSAFIICADADVDAAVEVAHQAVFFNQGQSCIAGSRTFVHEDIYDEFVAKSRKRAEKVKIGSPFEADTEQGPQVSQTQFNTILNYIKLGKEEGAKLETGGARHGEEGYFIQPTVFSDVRDDMTIAKEEIFGPVQSIFKWKSVEEVLQRANATNYGLAAGVYTKSLNAANTIARGLKAGMIWVNCYAVFDANVPFGGYKHSGIGSENSKASLDHYTQVKAVYTPLEGPLSWQY